MKKILKIYTIIVIIAVVISQPILSMCTEITWEDVEPGLQLANVSLPNNEDAVLAVLRIEQKYFEFKLLSISENEGSAKTLMQWIKENNLVAGINASMYLPDGKTSTGYMRNGTYYNNKHMAKNFGAFFLANPISSQLPDAKLIDRDTEGWKNLLAQYDTVIQNFRLIDSNRKVLWSDKGQAHSIAAVAEDESGNILFLHCREPIKPHAFAKALLALPLAVRTVMYVEGGVQAGLVLQKANEDMFWGGWHPSDIFVGSMSVALPNILGIIRK